MAVQPNYGGYSIKNAYGVLAHHKTFYGQKYVPYKVSNVAPLPYSLQIGDVENYFHTGPWNTYGLNNSYYANLPGFTSGGPEQQAAYNRALDRLNDKVANSAGLGITLAQYAQSRNMVAARAMQLYGAAKALRKGNFRGFLRSLKTKPLKKHQKTRWTRPKQAADLWLEYSFGWAPLLGDIYDSLKVLQNDLSPRKVKASSRFSSKIDDTDRFGYNYIRHQQDLQGIVVIGVNVRVVHPNLALASQLGIINPAAILWDAIPFSFVIDWFVPVGTFLNSWTMFTGYELTNTYVTTYVNGKGSSHWIYNPPYQPDYSETSFDWYGGCMFRNVYTTPPGHHYIPLKFRGFSVRRGITAISLLLQQLRKF